MSSLAQTKGNSTDLAPLSTLKTVGASLISSRHAPSRNDHQASGSLTPSPPGRRLRLLKDLLTGCTTFMGLLSVPGRSSENAPLVQVQILAYAPTEFYHCQHCELVWDQIGFGQRWHAEQRRSGLLPPDLEAEYTAISDWVREAFGSYGDRLVVKVVDAASLEGVFKALRYGVRRFPAFIIDRQERIVGFDRERLDKALAARLGQNGPYETKA